jgi:hypothetical protein
MLKVSLALCELDNAHEDPDGFIFFEHVKEYQLVQYKRNLAVVKELFVIQRQKIAFLWLQLADKLGPAVHHDHGLLKELVLRHHRDQNGPGTT